MFYCRLAHFHHQAALYQLFLPYCKLQGTSRHLSTSLMTPIVWTWLKVVTTYLHHFLQLLLWVSVNSVVTQRGGPVIKQGQSGCYIQYCCIIGLNCLTVELSEVSTDSIKLCNRSLIEQTCAGPCWENNWPSVFSVWTLIAVFDPYCQDINVGVIFSQYRPHSWAIS